MSTTVTALFTAGKRVGQGWAAGNVPPGGLVGAVGDGFVPAVGQCVQETVFDFGRDVGVGLTLSCTIERKSLPWATPTLTPQRSRPSAAKSGECPIDGLILSFFSN